MYRFKKIEKCLEKENVDCLLLLTGVDGLQNTSTVSIFNWLFLGYFLINKMLNNLKI